MKMTTISEAIRKAKADNVTEYYADGLYIARAKGMPHAPPLPFRQAQRATRWNRIYNAVEIVAGTYAAAWAALADADNGGADRWETAAASFNNSRK